MNAQQILEQLTEAYAKRDLLKIEKDDALPAEVKKIIEDNEIAFADRINQNAALISDLESAAKQALFQNWRRITSRARRRYPYERQDNHER
jgi:hypothetical protein